MLAIIGSSGFIGTCLAKQLSDENIDFVIIDKKASQAFPNQWRFGDVTIIDSLY